MQHVARSKPGERHGARDANGNVLSNGHLDVRPGGPVNMDPETRGLGTAL
jgi:hypothetical protein